MPTSEELRKDYRRQVLDSKGFREALFPEDSNARFDALFAAIGNSTTKCLALLTMDQDPASEQDLHNRFLKASDNVWPIGRRPLIDYSNTTLIPAGLVATGEVLFSDYPRYSHSFKITTAGERFGKPIGAFLIMKSGELPHALSKIFGPTSHGRGHQESRAVIHRARILEYLAKSDRPFLSEAEISAALGLSKEVIGNNLEILKSLGLVNYESARSERRGEIKYRLTEDAREKEIRTVKTSPTTTRLVAEIAFEMGTIDVMTVAEALKSRHPELTTALNDISKVLVGLAKQGILRRELGLPAEGRGHSKSKVSINKEGRRIAEEIIIPIRKALGPDGEELLSEWRKIPWTDYAPDAVRRARLSSRQAERRSRLDWASDAFMLIANNPGIRQVEIQRLLQRNSTDLVAILLDKGLIKKVKEGKAVKYYTADYDLPSTQPTIS